MYHTFILQLVVAAIFNIRSHAAVPCPDKFLDLAARYSSEELRGALLEAKRRERGVVGGLRFTEEIAKKFPHLLAKIPEPLTAEEVQSVAAELRTTPQQLLLEFLPFVRQKARPPLSGYFVGATGLSRGKMYFGVNLEFHNQALSSTVHAEQFLLARLVAHGETSLEDLACGVGLGAQSETSLKAFSCGHCRQAMSELKNASLLRIHVEGFPYFTLDELLPHKFGPEELGLQSALLNHYSAPGGPIPIVSADASIKGVTRISFHRTRSRFQKERALLLTEMQRVYAPYSGISTAVLLRTEEGNLYSGGSSESVAYNPSLPAAELALVDLVAHHDRYSNIREVHFLETGEPRSAERKSELWHTLGLVRSLAPDAKIYVWTHFNP